MTTVTVAEAQAKLPELLDDLFSGQEIVIVRDAQPVAQLIALPAASPQPVYGSCKGMLTILEEDEAHLADFQEYMG